MSASDPEMMTRPVYRWDTERGYRSGQTERGAAIRSGG